VSAAGTTPSKTLEPSWVDQWVFFSWWVRLDTRISAWPSRRRWTIFAAVLILGALARIWAQTLPGNWDFGQWNSVSEGALSGIDPYDVFGYNYTPIWLGILSLFKLLSIDQVTFRLLISIFLLCIDIWIAWMLARRGYSLAAYVFLLSPIAIAISGQHQQIDGLAVALALAAMLLMGKGFQDRITKVDIGAVVLLGLSLSVKQVFLVFPLWLAMRPGALSRRLLYLVVPPAIFLIMLASAFIPYSPKAVVDAVLFHAGTDISPFVLAFIPHQLAPWVMEQGGAKVLSLLILIPAGLLFRRLRPFEAGLAYSITALLFAWSVANQYLVIPMAAIAVFLNIGLLAWFALSTLYLGGASDSLNLPLLNGIQPHVMLEWQWMGRDLFPYLLIGWIIFLIALRRPHCLAQPSAAAVAREDARPGKRLLDDSRVSVT